MKKHFLSHQCLALKVYFYVEIIREEVAPIEYHPGQVTAKGV